MFDMDTTQFDISILQDEIEMLMEEEQHLDNLIFMNEYVLFGIIFINLVKNTLLC